MATRRRNLFLYLTIACFLGLITIFIVDGYMGTYDTLHVTTGERPQTIGPDAWLRQGSLWSIGMNQGEKASFRYEIDNRQFSIYTSDVDVSVWRNQEKVQDLVVSQSISINAFAKGELMWVVDSTEILPGDFLPKQGYQYTLTIKRGEIERNLILRINPDPFPPMPIPVPSR